MSISRRQFMKYALAAITTTALNHPAFTNAPLLKAEQQVDDPWMAAQGTGTLEDEVMAALMTVVRVYVGDEFGPVDHYPPYFAWRAENLQGYRALYRAFAAGLNGMAQREGGTDFVDADEEIKRDILRYALDLPSPSSPLHTPRVNPGDWLQMSTQDRLWLRFDRYIIAQIVDVFIQTNAWIMLGYEGWRGQATGLDTYMNPLD